MERCPTAIVETVFSLVELMTVIVIIGILAAIAAPVYRGYVVNARLSEGYVLIEAIRKAEMTHHMENGLFGIGQLFDVSTATHWQTILDGGKIPAGGPSVFVSNIGRNVFPAEQMVGFLMVVLGGGMDERIPPATSYGLDVNSPISMGGPSSSGTSCDVDYSPKLPSLFGVNTSPSPSYDWVLIGAIANVAYPETPNCVFFVQRLDTNGDGFNNGPILTVPY
jgi:prepilin-type N-terminal cleavage/methylation domain-containing protein